MNPKQKQEDLEEILITFYAEYKAAYLPAELNLAMNRALASLTARDAQHEVDPFDFVEPCEPECSPERHAYHQGQWDMAKRMRAQLSLNKKEGEDDGLTAETQRTR